MNRSAPPTPADALVDPLDQGNIGALMNGRHGAPFDVLGPHVIDLNGASIWMVRAFLPGARAAWVIPGASERERLEQSVPSRIAMRQLHPNGLYSVLIPSPVALPYQLEVERPSGVVERISDPYAFPPMLSDFDLYLIGEGKHQELYERMGAHPREANGVTGVGFAVWAPNARRVSVVGDFNGWDDRVHPMRLRRNGIWELFIPGVQPGALYKYAILSWNREYRVLKADPFAFAAELRPGTASRVWDLGGYTWADAEWIRTRQRSNGLDAPIAVYEIHVGSWRAPLEPHGQVTYRELAHQLVPYVKALGYTHVELMPVAEHPFDGSWGYQVTGYFAPTSRYGTPQDFMYFVDYCHQHGIGVLLDWVPAHFPKDEHGLNYFDGSHLFEHADPRQGEHAEWGTLVFNYGRNEVRNFLMSNALFWFEKYHVDGLRVDAVASMLYLDYSREHGQWLPNQYGGRENLDAVSFIRECNATIHARHPDVLMIAEESTSWPYVTAGVANGGLGFSLKWNMGWMHDVLSYFHYDPIYRSHHHNELTFSMVYAYSEKFILPFSHDEVVHMKGSLANKMPGDRWQMFANLRALYTYMYGHPGKKLLFMGGEFAQWSEWNYAGYLDWYLLDPGLPDGPEHVQVRDLVRDLNALLRAHPALFALDFHPDGYEWIDGSDAAHSVVAFMRYGPGKTDPLLFVCNLTPVPHHEYRVGTPIAGPYAELLNSDSALYGGSNIGNLGGLVSDPVPMHGRPQSLSLTLPPLATIVLSPRSSTDARNPAPESSSRRPRKRGTGGAP